LQTVAVTRRLLIIIPLVVGLILVGIFMPSRQVSIEGFGTLSFETAINLSVGSEAAYAHPAAPAYQSFTEAKSGPVSGPPNDVTSIAVNKPAGTTSGDLLIGVVVTDDDAGTFTPPSGWTLINAGTNSSLVTVGTWYKIAGGSEPASYTWSWTNPQTVYAFIIRITGHNSSNPINVSGFATGNNITPTSPDVNTTVADTLVLRIFGANWAQVTVDGGYPSGHTGITVDVSGDPSQIGQCSGGAAYKTQATAGATGTAAFTMTGAHEWRALTIAIAPPVAAPPAAPAYQSFAVANSATDVTSITVSKPSGTASGDLLIGVVVTDGNAGTFTPPSSWTLINAGTADPGGIADQVTLGAWYKIAGGSEPASYQWTWTNSEAVYAFIIRITGHNSSNPINVWGVATGSSTGTSITITCPTVTTTVNDTLVLRIFGADRAMLLGSYPTGHTGITFGSSSGDNTTMYQCTGGAAYKTQATAGATGTAAFTATPNVSATEEWRALTIAIAPPAAAPDISNLPTSKNFGTVIENANYWSNGSAPTFPLDDGECYFTVTNNSSGSVNISIKATNFGGGVGWNLTSGSPGQNTVRMKAGKSGDALETNMVTLTTSNQSFISGLGVSPNNIKKWEIKLETGTFTDSAPKTSTITLTATLA
jgi:hypothetical protein